MRLTALAVLGLVLAPGARAETAPPCAAELARLEKDVAAAPDDIFLGADYRQAVIRCEAGDRATRFFDRLTERHPEASSAWLNAGLAYVDRIPPAGDIRQARLGKAAAERLGRSAALRPSWLAHHVRGFVYLFYPRIFRVGRKAVADLESAQRLLAQESLRPCQARTYAALGDAWYWRFDDLARAQRIWAEGLALFPGDRELRDRVTLEGMARRDVIRRSLDADTRIDTSLRELREPPRGPSPALAGPDAPPAELSQPGVPR
jgi:tetratricopeptide (TPR) repeat protein